MDLTNTVLQTLADKIGKLEIENACLVAQVMSLQDQLKEVEGEE